MFCEILICSACVRFSRVQLTLGRCIGRENFDDVFDGRENHNKSGTDNANCKQKFQYFNREFDEGMHCAPDCTGALVKSERSPMQPTFITVRRA